MRSVILSAAVTLDGYIARPDGSFDFIPPPDAQQGGDDALVELFARIDVVAMGRKTLDDVRKHAGADPPKGDWKTYIFSRKESPGDRDGLTWVNDSPADFVQKLRQEPGDDVFLMGGGELTRAFLEADLVDELLLGVLPLLLGEGIQFFPPAFPERRFELSECRKEPNGVATLKYLRTR